MVARSQIANNKENRHEKLPNNNKTTTMSAKLIYTKMIQYIKMFIKHLYVASHWSLQRCTTISDYENLSF